MVLLDAVSHPPTSTILPVTGLKDKESLLA